MLSCVASHSCSDPACTPGQFGDLGFAPHSPASLAGQLYPQRASSPGLH